MSLNTIVIEGLDDDPSTRLELNAGRVEFTEHGGPSNPGARSVEIVAKRCIVTKVDGGIGPDSILGMVARSGRARISSAKTKLERPKAYAVRLRMNDPNGKVKMKTYTAASGNRYVAEGSFPELLRIVTNPVEIEELREYDQFEVVQINEDPGTVDGELGNMREELDRLAEHAEVIREDPDEAIRVLEEASTKAELFVRMLRGAADDVERKLKAANDAIISETTGGGRP